MLKRLTVAILVLVTFSGSAHAADPQLQKKIDEVRNKYKKSNVSTSNLTSVSAPVGESIKRDNQGRIYGYDKVPWGASVLEVKTAYPTIEFDKDWTDNEGAKNFVCHSEILPKDNIVRKRYFFFNNDKLYKVLLDFNLNKLDRSNLFVKKVDVDALNAIVDRLTTQYGESKLISRENKFSIFNDLLTREVYGWSLFNGKMIVELIQIINKGGSAGGRPIELLQVYSFLKDVEEGRTGKKTENNLKEKNIKVDF